MGLLERLNKDLKILTTDPAELKENINLTDRAFKEKFGFTKEEAQKVAILYAGASILPIGKIGGVARGLGAGARVAKASQTAARTGPRPLPFNTLKATFRSQAIENAHDFVLKNPEAAEKLIVKSGKFVKPSLMKRLFTKKNIRKNAKRSAYIAALFLLFEGFPFLSFKELTPLQAAEIKMYETRTAVDILNDERAEPEDKEFARLKIEEAKQFIIDNRDREFNIDPQRKAVLESTLSAISTSIIEGELAMREGPQQFGLPLEDRLSEQRQEQLAFARTNKELFPDSNVVLPGEQRRRELIDVIDRANDIEQFLSRTNIAPEERQQETANLSELNERIIKLAQEFAQPRQETRDEGQEQNAQTPTPKEEEARASLVRRGGGFSPDDVPASFLPASFESEEELRRRRKRG